MRSVIIDLIKTTIKKIFKLPLLLEFFFLTIPEIGSIEYSNSFFLYIVTQKLQGTDNID